jgi:ubiquinone/menaquinone biosynthesis C-methylase UbiE
MQNTTNVYDVLAFEYYDPARHPTCANFRDGSEQLIESWLAEIPIAGSVCEVGCGMSIVASIFWGKNLSLKRLYLTDSAPSMLAYSEKWESLGAHLLLADAAKLPFADESIEACVASLGDPYNRPMFWAELARVIIPGGCAVFTTPSFEWASRYRQSGEDSSEEFTAEFVLANGKIILAPSIICTPQDQVSMIENATELRVVTIENIVYSKLRSTRISNKLLATKELDLPVVTGYLIRKPA